MCVSAPGAAPDPHYRVRHQRRSDCWVTSSRVRRPGRKDPGCTAPLTWCSLSLARMAGNGRTEIRGQVVGEIHSMGENQPSTARLGSVSATVHA